MTVVSKRYKYLAARIMVFLNHLHTSIRSNISRTLRWMSCVLRFTLVFYISIRSIWGWSRSTIVPSRISSTFISAALRASKYSTKKWGFSTSLKKWYSSQRRAKWECGWILIFQSNNQTTNRRLTPILTMQILRFRDLKAKW